MSARLRFLVLLTAILPSSAFANGYVIPGTIHQARSTYDEWSPFESVSVPALKDNSYYCRAMPVDLNQASYFTFVLNQPGDSVPHFFRGNADGLFAVDLFADIPNAEKVAVSFTAQNTGTHWVYFGETTHGNGTGSTAVANVECFNTTLFGGFNTVNAANPVNFLEIRNISNITIDFTVVLYGHSGAEISRFSRAVAPNAREDVALHDIAGASNTFGSVLLNHNGALGALAAQVSKYTLSGTNLTITATEVLRERTQR